MKKILLMLSIMLFTGAIFLGCQDSQINSPEELDGSRLYSTPMGYLTVELLSVNKVGDNWEWLWAITNLNPGNKKQDMSHWGFRFDCIDDPIQNYMVSAGYGLDPENLTEFTPKYLPDGKANWECVGADPLLKFDYGTTGTQTSYYKLVLSKNFAVGTVLAAYKSGVKGGCDSGIEIPGPDCGTTTECSRETAFAVGPDCFLYTTPSFNRWGWRIGPVTESGSYDIYAGAGQCDVTKGTLAGTLDINVEAGTVTYNLTSEYVEAQLYVGTDIFPKDKSNNYTVAPGQYNFKTPTSVVGNTVTFEVGSLTGMYVIAHAVVNICE
jgi:hypothetical protein